MPPALQSLINDTNTQLKAIGDTYFDGIYDSMSSLHDWLDAEGNPNSADVVLSMRWFVGKLRDKYSTAVGSYRIRIINTLQWINDNWPEGDGAELTMAAILDAIWESTPLETFFFVNDIDAMRAAIWNTEISEQRLTDLYRHFSI